MPHYVIEHAYEHVRGAVHTQNIENHWSVLKRGIMGVYQCISPKHLQKYLDEFDFRANRRDLSDGERFADLLRQVGRIEKG